MPAGIWCQKWDDGQHPLVIEFELCGQISVLNGTSIGINDKHLWNICKASRPPTVTILVYM